MMKVGDLQRGSGFVQIDPRRIDRTHPNPDKPQQGDEKKPAFGNILREQISSTQGVQFSAHAARRIEERQVGLSADILHRLDNGVREVDGKGSKSALILVDDTAYIVSVKNRMVVTAIDNAGEGNNVFTNIDSVAIV